MSQQNGNDTEYEKAILWVPDPNSPAGWIRRKVWSSDEGTKPARQKPPMGFHAQRRPVED